MSEEKWEEEFYNKFEKFNLNPKTWSLETREIKAFIKKEKEKSKEDIKKDILNIIDENTLNYSDTDIVHKIIKELKKK